MKFTLSWLKEHLKTDASLTEIVDKMVAVGLEVEDIDDPAERLSAFTIGEVLSAEPHPDADKLRVCQVATKDGDKQIVCGASNARAGIKVAYAPVGAYVAGIDLTLSKVKIRGVESHGMMCSERELEISDEHEGIIEAADEAPVGDPVVAWLGANDPVIDFEVTPNRPDTNGVDGVARDLAAAGLGELITPAPEPIGGAFASPQAVELRLPEHAKDACSAFASCYVRGVKNGASPEWLQARLRAIGLRPINALVDITNYISYDRGRPLHVYDADKLKGALHARLGVAGETFLALDGKTYTVDETMTVIADDNGVAGLGGIIGGEDTGCTEETVNVLIECAYFDPLRTAKTGRKTGITSDARYRFERGVDPAFVLPGIEMAAGMVQAFCGGEASEVALTGKVPEPEKRVAFPPSEIMRLTGIDASKQEALRILKALGFTAEASDEALLGGDDPWPMRAPSWRPDIVGKADLVEEVARIIGFDNLPTATLPLTQAVETPKLTPAQNKRQRVRRALAVRGMYEAVTWSFLDANDAALFRDENEIRSSGLVLANPIASDLGVMRSSILPNLINAIQRNVDRGRDDLALYEVAPTYGDDTPAGHQDRAGGVRRIDAPRHWAGAAAEDGVFLTKADALAGLAAAGAPVASLQTAAPGPDYFHPGRSGVLQLGPGRALAAFGEIHPRILKALDVDGPIYGFEINLDAIPSGRKRATKTKPALAAVDLTPVRRDFAFIADNNVAAEALLRAVRGAEKALIADVRLFDVYEGAGIEDGKKSLAVEVTLQPREKTLTDEEIDAVGARIIAQVEKATGATLRA